MPRDDYCAEQCRVRRFERRWWHCWANRLLRCSAGCGWTDEPNGARMVRLARDYKRLPATVAGLMLLARTFLMLHQ